MHEPFTGNWTRQSHVSAEHLNSVRGLNRRFLDLAGEGLFLPGLRIQLAPLSAAQRAAAANCPYALFDLRFADEAYWRARLQMSGAWRIADEPKADPDTVDFVRLALFYTWHVASSAGLTAHLLLGMHSQTAEAFRGVAVDALSDLALAEAANLTPRWSSCSAYWTALTSAAARPDSAALRRVQLSGLQLAAATQLPSEPREV
ncbi:MAG TPA: hypothetical protein VGN99_13775 [Steroidobacteraceae bacterium]|nr:hypothetical protein [Steroidobacteraceae bacterium]